MESARILPFSFKPLPPSFYKRSAAAVGPDLLGHWLVRRLPEGFAGGPIVEVEAYLQDDPACHAARGFTRRNSVMFGPPGRAYVYYIYGMHYCVNAVCMPEGTGEAVLIRAIEPRIGAELMAERRGAEPHRLTNGPAKLCAALSIDLPLNGCDLCDSHSELMIARDLSKPGLGTQLGPVLVTTRIGITKAAAMPLRFCLKGSPHLSRPAAGKQARQNPQLHPGARRVD